MFKYKDNKVLFIVDDNPIIAKLIESYLSEFDDVKIYTFESGEECLKNLHLNPSLIFLDYYLDSYEESNMKGCEVLVKVKEYDKDTQVIIMSGKSSNEIISKTTLCGSDGFFIKDNLILDKVKEKVNDSLSIFTLVKKYKRSKIIKKNLYLIILLLLSIILKLSI